MISRFPCLCHWSSFSVRFGSVNGEVFSGADRVMAAPCLVLQWRWRFRSWRRRWAPLDVFLLKLEGPGSPRPFLRALPGRSRRWRPATGQPVPPQTCYSGRIACTEAPVDSDVLALEPPETPGLWRCHVRHLQSTEVTARLGGSLVTRPATNTTMVK